MFVVFWTVFACNASFGTPVGRLRPKGGTTICGRQAQTQNTEANAPNNAGSPTSQQISQGWQGCSSACNKQPATTWEVAALLWSGAGAEDPVPPYVFSISQY